MASEVVEEGRGLVLVLNKADLLPPQQREKVLARLQAAVRESLPQVPGVACLWTSATTGERTAAPGRLAATRAAAGSRFLRQRSASVFAPRTCPKVKLHTEGGSDR